MPIRTDQELADVVADAGRLLQEIQLYVGRDFTKPAKVRFPRGYLRTATVARRRLDFLQEAHLRSNIAYTMMLADVQHWLLARTDLYGIAKEMVIKLQIFLLGSIVESLTKVTLRGRCGASYAGRTKYMADHAMITTELQGELDWLWSVRNRMHLFKLDDIEWLSTDYTTANHNRATRCFQELLQSLERNP